MTDHKENYSRLYEEVENLRRRVHELETSLSVYQEASIRKRESIESAYDYLQMIIDNIADPTLVIAPDYSIIVANKKVRDLAGGIDPVKERLKCYEVSHHRKSPCKGRYEPCPLKKVLKSKSPFITSHIHFDSEKNSVFVDIAASPILDKDGRAVYVIESCRDISDRINMEEALRDSEMRYRSLFEQSSDAIFIMQAEGPDAGRVLSANEAACGMHGYSEQEILQLNLIDLLSPEAAEKSPERLQRMIDGETLRFEIMHRRKDGTLFPVEVTASLIKTGDKNLIIAIDRDITKRRQAEAEKARLIEELKHISRRDGLTGILNRQHLDRRMTEEIHRAKRYRNPLSLIMFDIDNFKKINDSYGHVAGDKILQKTADVIRETIRDTDIAGRFGGDEFAIILTQTDINVGMQVAERLRARIEEAKVPVKKSRSIRFTVSVGICQYDVGMKSTEEFISRADSALYIAKNSGHNVVCKAED